MIKFNSIKAAMGIKSAKPAKEAAKVLDAAVMSSPIAAKEAKGAEAMANQGRAMVHQYQKPEVKVVEMENPKNLRATSDWSHGPQEPDIAPEPETSFWDRENYSIWDN